MSPSQVRDLQRFLNKAGFSLKADGIFGPRTLAAFLRFQVHGGPPTDQLVRDRRSAHRGPIRARRVEDLHQRPPDTVRPSDLARTKIRGPALSKGNVEEQFQHYQSIVESAGGRVTPGERTVLALRSGAKAAPSASKKMRDEVVVLWRDGDGRAHVEQFTGSTTPGQRRSGLSPDVDGDGQGDVGLLSEGSYRVSPNGLHNGAPSFVIRTERGGGRLPAVRDTNHDGRFSSAEAARSEARGDRLSEVLFHRGRKDGGVRSIGCMNVQDWDGFVDAIGGPRASFNFTLVTQR